MMSDDNLNDMVGISRCSSGCVCLHFGISVVHLQPHEFIKFVSMVNRALPSLTDDETLLAVAGQWGHA